MVTRLLSNPDTRVVHICMSGPYPEEHLQNILESLSFDNDGKKLPLDEKTKSAIINSISLAYSDDLNESYKQLEQLQEENLADLSKLMIIIQDLDDMSELYAFRDFTSGKLYSLEVQS
ncbi:BA75_03103T0 [Komagataella pastoris]|uniref:BA75_03103T0 n=1 Tax=Komagataella pastoris TaxID=4922 RepID=A0A1B2JDJ9_PICPA|nr:BA75_03103T0 [Komagataella pastoris]